MVAPATQYSLDHHLFERMKFSGLDKENLTDLISIVVSLKNKYGIVPFAASPKGHPVPDGLTVRYLLEGTSLHKVVNILLDTPRLNSCIALPRGIPSASQFDVSISLGG
jgi:hypothetical protein